MNLSYLIVQPLCHLVHVWSFHSQLTWKSIRHTLWCCWEGKRRKLDVHRDDILTRWNSMHLHSLRHRVVETWRMGCRADHSHKVTHFYDSGIRPWGIDSSSSRFLDGSVHSTPCTQYNTRQLIRCQWAFMRPNWISSRNNIKLGAVHQILCGCERVGLPSGANLGWASFRERYCTALFIYSNYIGAP